MPEFPYIRQHDAMQCGVACLGMVCEYYGKEYSLMQLERVCAMTKRGVSLLNISEAAQNLGFHTIAGRYTLNQLCHSVLPCILHWNQNHFVVLYKTKGTKAFYIADPAKGLLKFSRVDFESHWLSTIHAGEERGIAMLLQPTPLFYQKDIGNQPGRKRTFGFLFSYLWRYRKYLAQIALGLLLGCVLQLIMPFLTQAIVDVGIKERNISFVWLILIGEFVIVIGRTVTDFIRRWLLLHISMRINVSLVSDFLIKLLRLPMSFFDTKLLGDIMQRMNDHGRVQSFMTGEVLGIAFTLLSFIVFGTVLYIYNSLIFLVFVVGSVLYGLWISSFLKKRRQLDFEIFEKQGENQDKTFEFITNMQEIKLQDCELRRRWEWEDVQADLFMIRMKSLKLQQAQEAGSIFINEIKNIVITVLSATAVINGELTLGGMLAIQYIIGQLNSPVAKLMGFFYAVQDVKISLERINEIHGKEEEDFGRQGQGGEDIELRHVDFKYNPHSPHKTLEDISIRIPRGKVTAIVGPSGSGKTTLIKLMLGYYKVTGGTILVGDENLDKMNMRHWRRRCGVVMQDGAIFSESIARNIAVVDGDVDLGRLEMAAKVANIYDYIMGLPLKFNTVIGRNGTGISHGQRQRLLIARAVYKNPDFIFLDEATNSLDACNERVIVENLSKFYAGKTVVVVAHRLSTVRDADTIVVLNKGRIVESGCHEDLIANKCEYYELVKNQLELGI